jgi:pantothenate kinase
MTPGPWKIDMTTMFDCGYSRSSAAIVGANGAPVVLISAAPDLLEALMMAVSALERSDYIQMDGDSFDVIEVSRAAIAKARGEK